MDYYAGIDVSLELSSVCVVDSSGKIIRETKVASEPEVLLQQFSELGLPIVRVSLEAGPLSQWLREGLVDGGLDAVLLETRHVKGKRDERHLCGEACIFGEVPGHQFFDAVLGMAVEDGLQGRGQIIGRVGVGHLAGGDP